MRDTSSTVSQEIELVRAFLGIVKVRLGERFAFEIKKANEIADAQMPPMMLLPLVDHAIAHGVADVRASRSIGIRTAIVDRKGRFEIADSGPGFLPASEGEGISGIRERLIALYGDEASLFPQKQQGDATEAVLEIPIEAVPQSDG